MTPSTVMSRAWAIFRETYRYPAVPFAAIGRACFASCLRMAWQEARQAAAVNAIPAIDRLARIEALKALRERTEYMANWSQARGRLAAIDTEIFTLTNSLAVRA